MRGLEVALTDVTKRFDDVVAVDGIDLTVHANEFVSLLGPSGCGKTTTLRMIAGFEYPDGGEISIGGESVVSTPPYRREVGMVFQDYALFPHRTVAQNIAFGLRMRKVARQDIVRRVDAMLDLLHLGDLADRKPGQLSGGQQQRAALGRALAIDPAVVLLDEPLGALDLKLRKRMQLEVKQIHREVGGTFIYVTHDQEEAITMSDRIAVMNEGRVLQIASPMEVYAEPATRFVAEFIGEANVLEGMVDGEQVQCGPVRIEADMGLLSNGEAALVIVRPERVRIGSRATTMPTSSQLKVRDVVFAGPTLRVLGSLGPFEFQATTGDEIGTVPRPGDVIDVGWDVDDALVIPASKAGRREGR
jgi:spermidine/putrescine transport system ATP-binding protein